MGALQPADPVELAALIQQAGQQHTPVWTTCGDSKWDLGCGGARATSTALHLHHLKGVVSYEPDELVLVVGAATPLSEIEHLLAEHDQHLAFEPVHWRETATVGGLVATGMAGPRRFCAGGVRDYVLGLQFVDGRGRLVRSGGRVVKNVSGYDLWRGLTGSFGQLGIITEICFKLWPRPASERTLIVNTTTATEARQVMLELSRRQEQITGLACDSQNRLFVRLEGTAAALPQQIDAVAREQSITGDLVEEASRTMWKRLGECENLREQTGVLWRFVLPAGHWVNLVQDLSAAGVEQYQVDWGGGLVWAVVPKEAPTAADASDGTAHLRQAVDAHAAAFARDIHTIAARHEAIAWRMATAVDDRNDDAMAPLAAPLGRLNQRLQLTCDPFGILNPGRSVSRDSETPDGRAERMSRPT